MTERIVCGVRCRPIPSTHGVYWAGEDGHVYRLESRWRFAPHRLGESLYGSTAKSKNRGEYVRVKTYVNGVYKDRPVHRLVAEAWCPDFHPLLEVHHINRNELDNRPGNLVCLTRFEHMREHGEAVRDVDIADARGYFEEHKDDPVPNVYGSAERARAKKARTRRAKNPVGTVSSALENMVRRCENIDATLRNYEKKHGTTLHI